MNIQDDKKPLFKWFWNSYVRAHVGVLFIALIFMSIEGSMLGVLSYSIKFLFDNVLVSNDTSSILFVAVLIFSIFSMRAIAGFIHRLMTVNVCQKIIKILQDRMVGHLLNMDVGFHQKNSPGSLMDRVRADSKALSESVSEVFMTVGRDGFSLISLIAVVFFIDWKWSLIAFLGIPFLVMPILLLQGLVRSRAGENRDFESKANVRLDEIFHGITDIKLNKAEKSERNKFFDILQVTHKVRLRLEAGMAGIPAMIDIIAAIGFLAVMIFGAIDITSGSKTIGEFMSFFTAMALIFEPLRRLSNVSGNIQVAMASLERVFKIFEEKPSIVFSNLSRNENEFDKVGLEFESVYFSYAEKKIVENINFEIEEGTSNAIVGYSGSGKTTLFNLITRLIDPITGHIRINGVDLTDISLKELRSLISVVRQDGMMFDETILENIRFGKPMASDLEIRKAAKMAYVDEFSNELKDGLNTVVGPRGSTLSGGQRQRISIARAFLRNSPLLLLDEPTSALDSQSEKLIQKSLSELSKKSTTITIAHRLSTIVDSDKVLVLDNGKIVGQGKHDSLVKESKLYSNLFKSQVEKKNDE
ncbi:MAG: ABC transporter ATP-binding protein [Alphaproteobacteria bacterium]|nr:MAG: ABC transporter ATP-binding protein [Alphaproteobacteria bacterium]|tara:strand:+ start:671 stop:2428 length:1758 start_codon:yes stop_codon:yes gene_type:complete